MKTGILWTYEKLDAFEQAYRRAVKSDTQVFTYDGHEFLSSYARDLIDYLRSIFPTR